MLLSMYIKKNHANKSTQKENNENITNNNHDNDSDNDNDNDNDNNCNHNYNKILKSDWFSTALISALIGQYASCLSNWTVRAITRALKWLFFHS